MYSQAKLQMGGVCGGCLGGRGVGVWGCGVEGERRGPRHQNFTLSHLFDGIHCFHI